MPIDLPKVLGAELRLRLKGRQSEVAAALEERLQSGETTHGFLRVRALLGKGGDFRSRLLS
jgi:hypothetical protein